MRLHFFLAGGGGGGDINLHYRKTLEKGNIWDPGLFPFLGGFPFFRGFFIFAFFPPPFFLKFFNFFCVAFKTLYI